MLLVGLCLPIFLRSYHHNEVILISRSLDLTTVVSPSRWSSFSPSQPLLDFVGCDSSLASDHPFFESSLLFHLLPPSDQIVAGESDTSEESEHPRRVPLAPNIHPHRNETSYSSLKGKQEVTIYRTGSMSVSKDCDLNLASLSFALEAGERECSVLFVSEGSMTIDSCSFGSNSTINLDSPLLRITGSLTVKSIYFIKIKTGNEKGLFWIELTDRDEASFPSSTFSDCSSSTAALLSLTLPTTQPTNWDFDLSGLSFTSTSSNETPEGPLIFVSGSSFATLIVPSRFPEVEAETDMNKFWGVDSSTSVESSLLVYLVEIGNVIDVDGQKGKDIVHCGHFGVACETIGKAIERGKVEESSKLIRIQGETTMNERISPNSITLSILGDSISQPICVSQDGQFEIADGKLVLDSLSFSTTVASFTRSLITLHHFLFVLFIFLNHVCLDSDSHCVLDVTLAEGRTFTLSHSDNPFTSCSSPKATANLIFIEHPSLSASVFTSSLCFEWDQTAESSAEFVGKEGDHSVPVPLFLYFSSLGEEVFISKDSCDASICGFSEYPCASLSSLHTNIEDVAGKIITFRTSIDNSIELTLSQDITLSGNQNQRTIKETAATETSKGLFAILAKVSIKQLSIQVPSTIKHVSLLHCQTGSLEVSNCTLREADSSAIPSILIVVVRGTSLVVSESFFESICSSNENAVYLIEISEAVEVDSNGETFTKCGHFLLFCSSMELGVNRLTGADLEKIRVMESISMDIIVSLEGGITICGSTNESTLLFTPNGRFVNKLHIDIASSLSINSLVISFPTTAHSNPLFVSSCGTLSFISCSITSSIPITQTTDLEMTDCALIDSKGSVDLSSSTFERIEGNLKKRCVLWGDLEESVEVSVRGCSFEECSGDGEARWIELKGRNTLSLVGSKWEGSFNKTSVWSGVMVESTGRSESLMNGDPLFVCGFKQHLRLEQVGKVQIVNNVFVNPDELELSALTLDVSSSTLESDEGIVLCENGELIVQNVVVSSSRSINASLLIVSGGRRNVSGLTLSSHSFSSTAIRIQTAKSITLIGIKQKNTSYSTLLSPIDGQDVQIDSYHFTGKETPSTDDLSPSICSWDSGTHVLANSSASIFLSRFAQLKRAAISLTNSSLSVHSSTFSENTVPNSFSSAERTFTASLVPWQDLKTDSKFTSFALTLVGETQIPCGVFLEVIHHTPLRNEDRTGTRIVNDQIESCFETAYSSVPPLSENVEMNENNDWKEGLEAMCF
ncbi:hypothetical protein BLNAU_18244 [Blattamonas nauphoetae]|uniref:Uncharacterized protein n=1 Tax=Blattamonas nauphoetae TaxID=2049346 RepID=A0ABQ9X4T6_9EUKA|nr:hypothetical protein BLNAU_18244 [Blattamonas nauphoetae]